MKVPKHTVDDVPLVGGVVSLDFVNTIHDRRKEPAYDYIQTHDDLLVWYRRCAVIEPAQASMLAADARKHPRLARGAVARARKVREVLHGIFTAVAEHTAIEQHLMEALNEVANDAYAVLQLRMSADRAVWRASGGDFNDPLRLIVHSAVELLTGPSLRLVKACDACGWMYLDQSKNGSRRWCSMQTCGSIDKALRYYYKQKRRAPRG